jgi:shikimate kinase
MTRPRVVLVGPPGAGKSTIGDALARRLGVAFRDTDADVEAALGKPISEVFVDDGEAVFRAAERSAVSAALDEHDGVLALGGGAVVDPATREQLRGHRVVFLEVSLSTAVSRVGLARDRPLLLGSPRSQLKALMDARHPWYTEVATFTVDTSSSEPADVVEAILLWLEAS